MTITQYAKQGKYSETEAIRLRSTVVPCPRCSRPATQGEIEDLGECCSCDSIRSEVFEEEPVRTSDDYDEYQRIIRT